MNFDVLLSFLNGEHFSFWRRTKRERTFSDKKLRVRTSPVRYSTVRLWRLWQHASYLTALPLPPTQYPGATLYFHQLRGAKCIRCQVRYPFLSSHIWSWLVRVKPHPFWLGSSIKLEDIAPSKLESCLAIWSDWPINSAPFGLNFSTLVCLGQQFS